MAQPVPAVPAAAVADAAALPTLRKKSWHESKQLRKRVAFLLDGLNLIPTDICFRVGAGDSVLDIRGHKIFFALGSPVFHAMLYGDLKEQKSIVKIPDVTPEAFQCLKEYMYSDSFSSVTIANVMDVLVVAKKYMVSKLKRYCYHFIQMNIRPDTVIKFWTQAREAADEIVEKQCVAEIKRNTNAVLSHDLSALSKDQLVELTSWDDLTVNEYDLYLALKKWKSNQEKFGSKLIHFNRDEGGVLEYIRFGLFSPAQLAIWDAVFSFKDIQELYMHAFGATELPMFPKNMRSPVLAPFFLSVKMFISTSDSMDEMVDMEWQLFDTLKLVIWPDVAPKACQMLRQYVESGGSFGLSYRTQGKTLVRGMKLFRKLPGVTTGELAPKIPLRVEELEGTSAVWAAPSTVCFKWYERLQQPQLAVLSTALNKTKLCGKEPERVFGQNNDLGVTIGKVLEGSMERLDELTTSESHALKDYGFNDEDRPWAHSTHFAHYAVFECTIVGADGS